MTLATGTHLGPYEILARVGAGGMGEVYSARDTRLGRTVALKVLSGDAGSDARLSIRFQREAKVISALNHPHICALHDVGPDYLVMEYCDGKTLAHRIAAGRLPFEKVLEYGLQIAGALDQAHRAGIIHRDLKPSNIMLTKSGVKLLDFGLARQRKESPAGDSTDRATEEGAIVGTLQYMPPEVLQGKDADARSDIFALGLVLYELATGRPAFPASSRAGLIAAILEHDPAPIEELPALDRLIRACLEKDPEERIQSVHDVVLQLRWMAGPDRAMEVRRTSQHRVLLGLAAAVAATVLGTTAMWWMQRGRTSAVRPARFQLQPPAGVVLDEDPRFGPTTVAISPDGQWVAFTGRRRDNNRSDLYLRSTGELEARLITGSSGAASPFFSPDGRWLGFVGGGFLQKVAVEGGQPTHICAAAMVRGASWGADGTILFSANGGQLLRVSAEGGMPRVVTAPRPPEHHVWPQLLPGGKEALVTVTRGLADRWRNIGLMSLADGRIRPLVAGTYPRYANGRIVYGYAGTLFALPFDLKSLHVTGNPKPVLEDVYFYGGSGRNCFDLSDAGALVYLPGLVRRRDTEIVWVDRQGQASRAVDERKQWFRATLSPDGRKIAAVARETSEESNVWVFDLDRGGSIKVTSGIEVSGSPEWSPDGKSIYVTSTAAGYGKIVRINADGSGTALTLTEGDNNNDAAATPSPDGATMLFMRTVPPSPPQLMVASLKGHGAPRPFFGSKVVEAYPRFSPDGRWVAYESDETGKREVHVRPFPAGAPRVTISVDGGEAPFWSSDGRDLFYLKGKEVWSTRVSVNGGFRTSTPRPLFAAEWLSSNSWNEHLQASPDGRFLTVRRPPQEHPDRELVYAPNWIAELNGR